jgi:DNA invertase Pin-like site-specific DNA recombinase
MLECMEILSVATQKRINIYSVKGAWRLDQSIQSKIIAMAAEIERDLISQRTKEALRFKKSQGMILGRPPGPGKSKLDPYRPEIEGSCWQMVRPKSSSLGAITQPRPISTIGSKSAD